MKSKHLIKYLVDATMTINELRGELAGLKNEISQMKEGISILNTGMDEAYDDLREDRKLIRFIFDKDRTLGEPEDVLNGQSTPPVFNPDEIDYTREDDLTPPTFPPDEIDFTRENVVDNAPEVRPVEIVDVSNPPVFEPMADNGGEWKKTIVRRNLSVSDLSNESF